MKCLNKYRKTGKHPSRHEQASSMTLGKIDHAGMDGADATADRTMVARTQYGALCWRMHRGKVEVLLITSRDTGRWVIPKGWPIDGLAPAQTAAREAWEEAGVEGNIADLGLGIFDYEKCLGQNEFVSCSVEVFGLRVAELKGKFPERKERRRKWFDFEKAARKVIEPELRALLLALPARLAVA
jgi:8-oxo-dGTP pyrophosphatase MutT (NUDIX family)